MIIENIPQAKKKLIKEIKKILKRFLIFFVIVLSSLVLGALMFFYIEECYFYTDDSSNSNSKTKEELCQGLTQLNVTGTVKTSMVGDILRNMTKWCSDKETNIYDFADNDEPTCQFNYRMFYKWSHFTLSVAFTIGYGENVAKSMIGKGLTIIYALIMIPITTASLVLSGRLITASIKYLIVVFESNVLKRTKIIRFQRKVVGIEVLLNAVLIGLQAVLYHKTVLHYRDLFDAFYYIFISLSTIGFGDIRYDMAYFRSLGRATQSALVMTYIILFYISYSLLASFISTLTSLGTDKSFKTFRTVKMVRSNSGNMFKVLCESTSGQWNNKDIQEVLGSLEDTID